MQKRCEVWRKRRLCCFFSVRSAVSHVHPKEPLIYALLSYEFAPAMHSCVLTGRKQYFLLLRNGDHIKIHVELTDFNQAGTMATGMLK